MDLVSIASAVVILAYLSLALELVIIPVPSAVSAIALINSERAQGQSWTRQFRWLFPALVNIAVFAVPLLQSCFWLGQVLVQSDGADPAANAREGLPIAALFLGTLLVAVGRSLTVSVALAMRSSKALGLMNGTLELPLQDRGVFQYRRNPGLLGMYLFALGVLMLKPSLWFALGFGHYIWHMHRRILMEEDYLVDRFGRDYEAYLDRTRRYV
ncbi:MAG: methyltransferase [Pseudomonadota bacterium]